MSRRSRYTISLQLEQLEDRVNPAPALLASITLPGNNPAGNPAWDYSVVGGAASPLLADLDGDGLDEIIAAAADRQLYAYKHNPGNPASPTLFQQYAIPSGANAGLLLSTPVVATLPNGGKALFAGTSNGQVWGWNAFTGAVLPNWPRDVSYDAPPGYPDRAAATILGHVAAGDLDGDNIPEIVVTSFNQLVTAYRFDGSVMWRHSNDDTIFTGVVIADLEGDGTKEVIFGGDSLDATAFYWRGGRITCLSWDGRREWVKRTDQVIWSSPVAGDLNGDGKLEIIVGTGFFYPQPNPDAGPFPGNKVYALDHRGNDLPGWPYITEFNPNVDGRVYSSPALADMNGDGFLDVIVTDNREIMQVISGNPADVFVDAAHGNWLQPARIWQTQAFIPSTSKIYSSPIVADIDGDGNPDVVQADGNGYLRAFNGLNGSQIWEFTDPPQDGFGAQFLNAAAVGHFRPGANLQLVAAPITTQIGVQPLWPGMVYAFDLDPTTLGTPPWAQYRQDAGNNAIARPDGYLQTFIGALYTGALGRSPAAPELAFWLPVFRHSSLTPGIKGIIASQEARTRLINGPLEGNGFQGWFPRFLGRQTNAAGIAQYSGAMAAGVSYGVLQRDIVSSDESFLGVNGGNAAGWVTYLYQNILGRAPSAAEVNSWVAFLNANQNSLAARQQVAHVFFFSPEYTERTVRGWYQAYLNNANPPADSVVAAAWDLRRGRHEEQVLGALLTSLGDYAAVNGEAAWVRALYQDVLQRAGSAGEVANWLRALQNGTSMANIAYGFVRSNEYRTQLVQSYYQTLLGRQPNATELQNGVAGLNAGGSRTQLIGALAASDEYFIRRGSNLTSFINGVFNDLMGFNPDQAAVNFWLARANEGQNIRVTLPQAILGGEYAGGYFKLTINGWFYRFLRRYPNTPSHMGRIFESSENTQYGALGFVNYLGAGGNQEDIEVTILTSNEYINAIARHKAFWLGQRWLA